MYLLIRAASALWMYKLRFVWNLNMPLCRHGSKARKMCVLVQSRRGVSLQSRDFGQSTWWRSIRWAASISILVWKMLTMLIALSTSCTDTARTLCHRQNVLRACFMVMFQFLGCAVEPWISRTYTKQSGIMWQNLPYEKTRLNLFWINKEE